MKTILTLILFLVIISCCKEPEIPENSMIGDWRVVQVDSLVVLYPEHFYLYKTFYDTDTIHFYSDSMGRFEHPIRTFSGSELEFRWVHDTIANRMDFNFPNGVTNGFLKGELTDTVKLYLRDYLSLPRYNSTRYYCLYMVKI
jgi:hypothetical protein